MTNVSVWIPGFISYCCRVKETKNHIEIKLGRFCTLPENSFTSYVAVALRMQRKECP